MTAIADRGAVTRVLIASGKVYFDLAAERKKSGNEHAAIVRLEQFYPFPKNLIADELSRFGSADGGSLGAGGASEHGRLVFYGAATARDAWAESKAALRGPPGERKHSDRLAHDSPDGAAAIGEGSFFVKSVRTLKNRLNK